MKRLAKETIEAIATSYTQGFSLMAIAHHYGVSYTTVRYHVFAHGIPLKKRGRPNGSEDSYERTRQARDEAERVTGAREGAMERVDG